jgi:uncharacterized protein (DUF697 family)
MNFDKFNIKNILFEVISNIPESGLEHSSDPHSKSKGVIKQTAMKAAMLSAGFSLPSGPASILTIIPDLLGIWNLQRSMVADIAALHGKKAILTKEQLLYCLFRHSASQVFRDILVKAGTKATIEKAVAHAFDHLLERIGLHIAKKTGSELLCRAIPFIGTAGAACYAYADTEQVGNVALKYFGGSSQEEFSNSEIAEKKR